MFSDRYVSDVTFFIHTTNLLGFIRYYNPKMTVQVTSQLNLEVFEGLRLDDIHHCQVILVESTTKCFQVILTSPNFLRVFLLILPLPLRITTPSELQFVSAIFFLICV